MIKIYKVEKNKSEYFFKCWAYLRINDKFRYFRRLGLNTSRCYAAISTWHVAVNGTRPIDRGTKIRAKSHLAHARLGSARRANKVNAQSPSIISISAPLSPERGAVAVQRERREGRIIATAPPRTPLPTFSFSAAVSCTRSRARFTITSVVSVLAADK